MYGISTVASRVETIAFNKLLQGMIQAIFLQGAIASLFPLWLSIKSQRKGSTFLPFLEHALSDISKVRMLFNVGADFGRRV